MSVFIGFRLATVFCSNTMMISPLGIIIAENQGSACSQADTRWPDYARLMVMPWERVPEELRREAITNDIKKLW